MEIFQLRASKFVYLIIILLSYMIISGHCDVLEEQIDLLKVKIQNFHRFKKGFIDDNPFFRNKAGGCPQKLGYENGIVCSSTDRLCLCWSLPSTKVNWFTANAFCNYYGMILISPASSESQNLLNLSMIGWKNNDVRFWTSGKGHSATNFWIFDNAGYQSSQVVPNIPLEITHVMNNQTNIARSFITSCLSTTFSTSSGKGCYQFNVDNCLTEKRSFICQNYQ